MIRICLAGALLALAATVVAADLDTILAENARAHGGDAYAEVDALRVRLRIQEPTFEVEGVYHATRDGRMRIDIYAEDQRVYAEGLGAKCAWEWRPDQPAEELGQCVGAKETAALRHGIELPGHFYTIEQVRARGAKVELIGAEQTDTGAEWQVRVTLADGHWRDYFIDQDTYRINRGRDQRAFHPGVDPLEITVETRLEAPQLLDGVLRFMRQESFNGVTGEWLNTTTVIEAEHNPAIIEGMFEAGWVPAGE